VRHTILGWIPFIACKSTDEAMRIAGFTGLGGWYLEINERSFPWISSAVPAFEAQLVDYPTYPYLRELDRKDFKLPDGFQHGDHTHLLSYHMSLPLDRRLRSPIAAARAIGRVFAGRGVMTLGNDASGGWHRHRDPDSSEGNYMYELPFRRGLGVHSSRGYFNNYSFLIVRPSPTV
jgi:hypothetical protein